MMLYEINLLINQLADQIEIDEETGEILCDFDAIMEQINALDMERHSILEYLAKLVLNYRAEATAMKGEEERLKKRRSYYEKKEERLLAIPAHPQRRGLVRHHQREKHLNGQQQRMEIPHQHRVVVQLNVVGRRVAAESRKPKPIRLPIDGILAIFFKVIVIQKGRHELEAPVFEYRLQPVIAFPIVAHKAHNGRLRIRLIRHNECHHGFVILLP